jgi:hypothetical protein
MKNIRLSTFAAGVVFSLLAQAAFAQYVWMDEKGVKQFSDMPPPASVPKNRILKQPGAAAAVSTTSSPDQPADTNAKSVSSSPKGPMSTAEQNADFRKRQAEKAEKDKKAAEEAKRNAAKASNCERARSYQRSLESGERISRTDANGERVYLDDAQREHDLQEARRIAAECK